MFSKNIVPHCGTHVKNKYTTMWHIYQPFSGNLYDSGSIWFEKTVWRPNGSLLIFQLTEQWRKDVGILFRAGLFEVKFNQMGGTGDARPSPLARVKAQIFLFERLVNMLGYLFN